MLCRTELHCTTAHFPPVPEVCRGDGQPHVNVCPSPQMCQAAWHHTPQMCQGPHRCQDPLGHPTSHMGPNPLLPFPLHMGQEPLLPFSPSSLAGEILDCIDSLQKWYFTVLGGYVRMCLKLCCFEMVNRGGSGKLLHEAETPSTERKISDQDKYMQNLSCYTQLPINA